GLRKVVRRVWRLTPAQCQKVKKVGDLMTGKLATEAPVNGGRNYNGPKVAKFLVKWKAKKTSFQGARAIGVLKGTH
ncbi:hypothetical protein L195_g032188, partial [Trifolium pratense]